MIVWTNQPGTVYQGIMKNGFFICDPSKSVLLSDDNDFQRAYSWMIRQLKERVGMPPKSVRYPIWAWYKRNFKHQHPDFRECRDYDDQVCMEIEISENDILLSDFDNWHCVLNNYYLATAKNETEFDQKNNYYDSLSVQNQGIIKHQSWQKIFDIRPCHGEWTQNGAYVQGCFWRLDKNQIRKAWRMRKGFCAERLKI